MSLNQSNLSVNKLNIVINQLYQGMINKNKITKSKIAVI